MMTKVLVVSNSSKFLIEFLLFLSTATTNKSTSIATSSSKSTTSRNASPPSIGNAFIRRISKPLDRSFFTESRWDLKSIHLGMFTKNVLWFLGDSKLPSSKITLFYGEENVGKLRKVKKILDSCQRQSTLIVNFETYPPSPLLPPDIFREQTQKSFVILKTN